MNPDSPITVILLTLNEERNIRACLESAAPIAREILIVDSGSIDATLSIASEFGARVVANSFVNHAKQWNFAFAQAVEGEWVLGLDADHRISARLGRDLLELAAKLPASTGGIYLNRLRIFRGKAIRFGGDHPKWMLKMVRRGQAFSDEREQLDARFYVKGDVAKARGLLIEDNANEFDINFWVEKHTKYAARQAKEEFARRSGQVGWATRPSLVGSPDARTLWLKGVWYRMPLFVRPFLYFGYRYFVRLGFLDGRAGLVFNLLQGFWYRLMVDINLDSMFEERAGNSVKESLD